MGFARDIPAGTEGRSHADLFLGEAGARPASQLYLKVPVGQPALGRRGVRTDRYTLIVTRPEGKPEQVELYDRQSDPAQLRDVAGMRRDVVAGLRREELDPWLARTRDPWRRG
jgi:N-acetylglucosamine-6-sulfatase